VAQFFGCNQKQKTVKMETLTTKDTNSVLSDLIKINNDRIDGYEKAVHEVKEEDADLRLLFLQAIDQSRNMKIALGTELEANGGDMPTGTTGSGSIYRAWMEVKAIFTGHSRHAILANCEYGEDAAQKAYESALNSEHLPAFLADLVLRQKVQLKVVHDRIKSLL
jgi:uncharacterized protein (TIGR02284 family)